MTTIPTGNGNEMVEEKVFIEEGNSMDRKWGGGNQQACVKMRRLTWPGFRRR